MKTPARDFPPATTAKPNDGEAWNTIDTGTGDLPHSIEHDFSWIVRVLPQFEEQALADQFKKDKNQKFDEPENDLINAGNPQAANPLLCFALPTMLATGCISQPLPTRTG